MSNETDRELYARADLWRELKSVFGKIGELIDLAKARIAQELTSNQSGARR